MPRQPASRPACQLPADTALHSFRGSVSVTRGPCSRPCSPESCASATPAPFIPQTHPDPLLPDPSPVGAWSPAGWGVAGVPGGAISGLLCPPTSLVALRQFYGGRIEAVFLLAGLFLHFSSPALIFPGLPAPSLRTLPFPPPLICQPSQERGPLASKVIELLGGRQATVFCLSALGLLPLERG